MQILTHKQICQKIRRLAIEILERNADETQIILAGINRNGLHFAELLAAEIRQRGDVEISLTRIQLNPADPLKDAISIELDKSKLNNQVLILVDDVANTGRTLFYACQPILETLPKKLEVAVLVDRTHKSFPIQVDYMGLSLATTLKENIDVQLGDEYSVFLN